ncbi:unnamed protein product, partial [Chrysoparadoxa australica]
MSQKRPANYDEDYEFSEPDEEDDEMEMADMEVLANIHNQVPNPNEEPLEPPQPAAAAYASAPQPMVRAETNGDPRCVGVSVCCPIVFGSVAFWQGASADPQQTHKWSLYVRGPNGEDVSYFVSKVVFTLHPSFPQPVRELRQWPFEVSELGWGEFEAKITLHFKDPTERAVDAMHVIRLYPVATAANAAPVHTPTPAPVVAERYDEIVFTDPHESFFAELMKGQNAVPPK